MNPTPDHPDPDHLGDEILSALLDGASDAVAEVDAGVDAAAHLRACDRCAGRQAELADARVALAGAPVEPLDELTRRRLVAAALAMETARAGETVSGDAAIPIGRARARRHPALIGSAAAVVLALLVGVPFVLGNGGSGGRETLTAQAPLESANSFLGDLGDLSDRDNVRLRLSGVASDTYASAPNEAGPSPAAGAPTAAPLAGGSPGAGGLAGDPGGAFSTTTLSPQAPAAGSRSAARPPEASGASKSAAESQQAADSATADEGFSYSDQSARDRADTDRCVAALLDGPARGGKLIRSGTGTYQGRPAIVASFELAGGTEAFVTDRSTCEVLDRFSV